MIRQAIKEDIEGLKSIIESTELFPAEMLEPMIRPFLEPAGDGSIWLTFTDSGPVGVVYCVPEKLTNGTWNMLLLAVHSEYQNAGRGAAMVTCLENLLRSKMGRLVIVETSGLDEFEAARRFYRKLGYIEAGRIQDFYSEGDDKLIFTKKLQPLAARV